MSKTVTVGLPDIGDFEQVDVIEVLVAPGDVVAKWNADVVKALNAPDVREKMLAQGAEPAPTTPAEFAAFIAKERDKYARIVKASGARVD